MRRRWIVEGLVGPRELACAADLDVSALAAAAPADHAHRELDGALQATSTDPMTRMTIMEMLGACQHSMSELVSMSTAHLLALLHVEVENRRIVMVKEQQRASFPGADGGASDGASSTPAEDDESSTRPKPAKPPGKPEPAKKPKAPEGCCCCVSSLDIANIEKIDTDAKMGHKFNTVIGLAYSKTEGAGMKSCAFEWWEKTNVPAITGHTANVWTDMFKLMGGASFGTWTARKEPCPGSETVTDTDPPALGRAPGRTVTRTLEFKIVVNSGGGCPCDNR